MGREEQWSYEALSLRVWKVLVALVKGVLETNF